MAEVELAAELKSSAKARWKIDARNTDRAKPRISQLAAAVESIQQS